MMSIHDLGVMGAVVVELKEAKKEKRKACVLWVSLTFFSFLCCFRFFNLDHVFSILK